MPVNSSEVDHLLVRLRGLVLVRDLLQRRGATLSINPCIPASWPEYRVVWRRPVRAGELRRAGSQSAGAAREARQVPAGNRIRLPLSTRNRPLDPCRGAEEERPAEAR